MIILYNMVIIIWLYYIIWYSAVTLDNGKEEAGTFMLKGVCENKHAYS